MANGSDENFNEDFKIDERKWRARKKENFLMIDVYLEIWMEDN